jgi:hypothetical protein
MNDQKFDNVTFNCGFTLKVHMQSIKDYNCDNLNYPPKCAFHLNQIILKCVVVFQKTLFYISKLL